jgi:hypothetical protein
MLTGASFTAGQNEGLVQIGAGFFGTTGAAFNVVCGTSGTGYNVVDCASGSTNVIGVATNATAPLGVVVQGMVPVNMDGSSFTVGDVVCLSATVAGQGHDNGTTACASTATLGVLVSSSGTVSTMGTSSGALTTGSQLLTSTQAVVLLHIKGSATGAAATMFPCSIAADTAFTTGTTLCSQALTGPHNYQVHCVLPWNYNSGTGTATFTLAINQTAFASPGGGGAYWSTRMINSGTAWSNMGALAQTATGVTNLITAAGLSLTDGNIYTAFIDGTAMIPSAGGTFSVQVSTSTGGGLVRAGGSCIYE